MKNWVPCKVLRIQGPNINFLQTLCLLYWYHHLSPPKKKLERVETCRNQVGPYIFDPAHLRFDDLPEPTCMMLFASVAPKHRTRIIEIPERVVDPCSLWGIVALWCTAFWCIKSKIDTSLSWLILMGISTGYFPWIYINPSFRGMGIFLHGCILPPGSARSVGDLFTHILTDLTKELARMPEKCSQGLGRDPRMLGGEVRLARDLFDNGWINAAILVKFHDSNLFWDIPLEERMCVRGI